MLQQTRVEAVRGYYERFLRALPDVASLAAAPEDQYLKLWEGLGYYSRVRNLHKAACVIMEEHGGRMPETAAELRKLPGIGPYTSAAIASIAFGERIPAIDGNLLRVFARMTAWQENIKTPASASRAGDYFSGIMPADRPGDFNQALMDLGAMICLPGGLPRCEECPWAEACVARQQGVEKELPKMPPKAAKKIEDKTVFLIRSGSRIMIRKRPARGLLAGMYEFFTKDCFFNYDRFAIVMNDVDSLRFYARFDGKVYPVEGTLERLSGTLEIDEHDNKSSVRETPDYPKFHCPGNAYKFYRTINGGVFDLQLPRDPSLQSPGADS